MKPVRILAIATVASFGMSTAVQAADPLPPLMVDIPAVAAEPSFGWGGSRASGVRGLRSP